jgi:hypothetical protein
MKQAYKIAIIAALAYLVGFGITITLAYKQALPTLPFYNNASGDKEEKAIPATDEEIKALSNQSKEAMKVFAAAIVLESGIDVEAAQENKDIIQHVMEILGKIEKQPQLFNSPLGFDLVWELDNASYNALWCVGVTEHIAAVSLYNKEEIDPGLIEVNKACKAANHALYEASIVAPRLYRQYLLDHTKSQKLQAGL